MIFARVSSKNPSAFKKEKESKEKDQRSFPIKLQYLTSVTNTTRKSKYQTEDKELPDLDHILEQIIIPSTLQFIRILCNILQEGVLPILPAASQSSSAGITKDVKP